MEHKFTNRLIEETSPYLLQHAHNPVDWYPWGEEALKKAKKEDKLILVSIGYSACHWCHVMEHESFEDEETAALMNEFFVCIKVDREERPDIDQVYMLAVQLMAGQGGWPLNCFTLPDGRPIYGGTYFPNQNWRNVLLQLHDFYRNNPEKAREYATELVKGLRQTELIKIEKEEVSFNLDDAKTMLNNWRQYFDWVEGGPNKAPKFPLPNNFEFLLRYNYHLPNEELAKYIELTLTKMAYGGIYDQIGGGFSRYSVDNLWKVPHFEKMLYDNAQLVSLYSQAYSANPLPLYKDVIYETLEFIRREMTSEEGGFYSALDADSEGEEGKFYVWQKLELERLLGKDFQVFADYYNVNSIGFWEHENHILLRKKKEEELAELHKLSLDQLKEIIKKSKSLLLSEREKRIRPGLDDKQLTSWNALMIKAYVDAYNVFSEKDFLESAEKCTTFILNKLSNKNGGLNHSYKKGISKINGYLEDYCFFIEALIALYEATFEEKWLIKAKEFAEYCIHNFYDEESAMFFFTSKEDEELIARKTEINDNVIPASNSSLAKALFKLGHFFSEEKYIKMSEQMLKNVKKNMSYYPSGYSNWGLLLFDFAAPFYEIAICGEQAEISKNELNKKFNPNKIIAGSKGISKLPLLENRLVKDKTFIYVCQNKTCSLPLENLKEAILQIERV
jgi:uncharacterized protein